MPFQSKAQMKLLFATKPNVAKEFAAKSQNQNNSNLPEHKKKKGNLSGAARRKLASMQAAQKKQGQKNGNN